MAIEVTRPGKIVGPDIMSGDAALRGRQWNSERNLSSALAAIEGFLSQSCRDRVPWLSVAFGTGIAAWFALPKPSQWAGLIALCCAASLATRVCWRRCGAFQTVSQAFFWVPLMVAAGCVLIWGRSMMVGTPPIERPLYGAFTGRVLAVEPQSAQSRRRLVVATRDQASGRALKIRLNLPDELSEGESVRSAEISEGSLIQFEARIMPPAAPLLPGGYNFARTAWFVGLAGSGTILKPVTVLEPAMGGEASLARIRRGLAGHVRELVDERANGIAVALVTGDRGGITADDAQAMRDSGLAHLLAISGLHVTAVIGLIYFLSVRTLALWPALALRVRLPVLASGLAALGGIGYTLLTGAQVPTVRSCIAALLVLGALALGREALSLRILAVAAFAVMFLWPEAVVGPSFQMSFAAVLAIVALSTSAPVRNFLGPREESAWMRGVRWFGMLMLTGLVIELALMPIALFHFHKAGLYGSLANLVAIPLTTFVIMPGVVLALAADIVSLGAPLWAVVGWTINAVLGLAHWVSAQPGAVTLVPGMGEVAFTLFLAGGFWLALLVGKARLLGALPCVVGSLVLYNQAPPDLLIAGDGRNVGVVERTAGRDAPRLLLLRDTRSDYVRDNFQENAGLRGEAIYLPDHPGARCNADFCSITLQMRERAATVLLSRSRDIVPERELAAACDRADIVISDRWLPRACRPRWFKADRGTLSQTGGLSVDLSRGAVRNVAQAQGMHGWWRGRTGEMSLQDLIPPMPSPSSPDR
ncbi:MAG: ComEC/Rec2 family competence protein [Pseudomonadota bacterium]|nr:ComEC/Rec2 family competence protein [Pseudomonadota bacterium]